MRHGAGQPSGGVGGGPVRHPRLAQELDVRHHAIQPLAGDVLHDVVEDPVVLAEIEHRHDVRVVQPGRGAGLVTEAAEESAVGPEATVQNLERHVGAERLAASLVHDAHPTLADEPEDAVVAKLVWVWRVAAQRAVGRERTGDVVGVGFQTLHLRQRREQVQDVCGVLGMAVHVLG